MCLCYNNYISRRIIMLKIENLTVKTKDNVILEFVYYDNAELNYPLNLYTNITKTANDCENLPQLTPIPQ